MSIQDWKMENDLCRCCHSEGTFVNLAEPCMRLEKEEIYSEMLQQCLDLNIIPIPGPLCASTYTICPNCILRLRDAFHFKEQVKKCELKFKELYNKDAIKLSSFIEVKLEQDVPNEEPEFITLKQDDAFDTDYDDDGQNVSETEQKPKEESPETARPKRAKTKTQPKAKAVKTRKVKSVQDKAKQGLEGAEYYHIQEERYVCNICERSFSCQPLVSQHYRFVHLKKRPRDRKCPRCEKRVPGHLRAYHLEDAHGIPAPSCGVCQKRFRYPCQVLQHQKKVHMGEKMVSCEICDKQFFDNLTLKSHMLTHSNERRYKCDFCNQGFRWKNNLKDHIMIHVDERRYTCKVCGKAYVQKSALKRHAERNHR